MKHKQATRERGNRVELTGATDENGVLVKSTGFDIERLTREHIHAYNTRRREQLDRRRTERERQDDERLFTEEFVRNKDDWSEAAAKFKEHRSRLAAEAAARADAEVLQVSQYYGGSGMEEAPARLPPPEAVAHEEVTHVDTQRVRADGPDRKGPKTRARRARTNRGKFGSLELRYWRGS